jgi:ABC-type glycerol-3-phosphate transport system permease component
MRKRAKATTTTLYLILVASGLAMIAPLYWMFSTSFKPVRDVFASPPKWIPNPFTLQAYHDVFTQMPFARYFLNSVVVTGTIVILNVLLGTAGAYAFAKLRFPGRNVIFFSLLITLMVPFQVNMIPLYRMMVWLHERSSLLGVDTYFGIIAPSAVGVFGIFLMRQFLSSIPDAILDAARLDGCSEFRILGSIIFPLAKPGMAALAIFTFLDAWNNFLWPLIVTDSDSMRTLPVGLAMMASKHTVNWTDTMAGAVVTTLPMLLVFAVLQRRFIEGLTGGAVKDG